MLINENENIIGFTRFGKDENDDSIGWIDLIFIDDDFHKKGFGKLLLNDAFAHLIKDS